MGIPDSNGDLTQRIWQPANLQRAPQSHEIKLHYADELCSIPWVLPESVKIALDVVRYSVAARKPAHINEVVLQKLKYSLPEQAEIVKVENTSIS